MPVNYVKFMRGSQELYNSLQVKDQDTLYFVYNNDQANDIGEPTGKLYLGNRLISSSSSNVGGDITLADISDVVFSEGLADGDFLVYDEAEGKWVNKSISEALNVPVMRGATADAAGASGLVPVPTAGSQLKFLRGDGTWAEVVGSLSPEDIQAIQDLQSQVDILIGDNPADEGKSVREILADVLVPENAKASLDTLEEIAAWIQDHPDDVASINADIQDLQSRVSDLEGIINGENGDPGLEDRVSSLETTMGTFTPVQGSYLDVGSAITYLNTSVTEINDRLRWYELSESA